MPRNKRYILFSGGILFSFVSCIAVVAMAGPNNYYNYTNYVYQGPKVTPPDTTKKDSLQNRAILRPLRKPSFFSHDRYGDPFSNRTSSSPLLMDNPSSIKLDVEADSSGNIKIFEKVGDLDYRPANSMSFDEFSKYQDRQLNRDYWKTKAEEQSGKSEVSGRSLIPKIYISPVFDRIFGGNYVDFKTNGFINLDFGGRYQRVANPNFTVRQQRQTFFEFDQQVSMNVIGQVGEKMKMTANFDTQASFQFEQSLKLEYTGFEEDIIQKIEAGNVSMPLNSTLISGAQNLFGIKTQLRFGRLNITSIMANQRSQAEEIRVQGGVQRQKFEIRASDYDENRHFFLSQYFRNNYERSLRTMPVISSGVTITRVEVYVTNRTNNTQTLRNIAAFLDLGEGAPFNKDPKFAEPGVTANTPTSNEANKLFALLMSNSGTRNVDRASGTITSEIGLAKGKEFELVRSARRLSDREFTFNPQLGYISLQAPLNTDEVLAVAYEYTYNGRKYKVGELTEDYQSRNEDEVIFLKLLRPSTTQLDLPTWDLMMKNIYSLNANQINREGLQLRIIYKDDITGMDNPSLQEGVNTKDIPLLQLLNMDRLNPQGDPISPVTRGNAPPAGDGNFDFVEGITIDSRNGRIIFPVLEPFGNHLEKLFTKDENDLVNKYVFNSLYEIPKRSAMQMASKNKFFIKGSFQSEASNEIMLPGIGTDENSVTVTAGGTPLVLGQDYVIENQRVRIINEGIANSGQEIKIQFEQPQLFNNQMKTLLGTRFDYELAKDFTIGSTFMRMRERPIISRVGMGHEPTNNTILGFDANIRRESRFLTKALDKLPLLQTKETSSIVFGGEFAQLFPGVSPLARGNSFIDDFEGSEVPYPLGGQPHLNWKLGSTPAMFYPANSSDTLAYAYRRAKLAWYTIDNIFYREGGSNLPNNISEEERKNHYTRAVSPQEIFPGQDKYQIQLNQSLFDIAYFPHERGMYNYNTNNLNSDGTFLNPENNWGAITRAIKYDNDFENSNIQYIEFWLMDPFADKVLDGNFNQANTTGGDLFFNLGNISEDVMVDGKHMFENGLPTSSDTKQESGETQWGKVPQKQFLLNAFDNSPGSRAQQDLGLDGLSNVEEQSFFSSFINSVPNSDAVRKDPSNDDFQYFLGDQLDADSKGILARYKNYNGVEGNSPEADDSPYARSATTLPDNEDLNADNTVIDKDQEGYFQYKINLNPSRMGVGRHPYIVDVVNNNGVNWYQFRIPIRENYEKVGNINDFRSIRFMRMFLTNFAQPVVLRFAQFQLVANSWRTYDETLYDTGVQEPLEKDNGKFVVSSVNIEENSGTKDGVRYDMPPGFQRDRDITTINNRLLNEQSLQLCVEDLPVRDSRAAFKNVTLDFINYKRMKMFLHAHSQQQLGTGEVTAFIRLGTDFNENYYEVEVPLKLSESYTDPRNIWPEQNEIDIAFADLIEAKLNRNRQNWSLTQPFIDTIPRSNQNNEFIPPYIIRVKGNPDLSTVMLLMIGVRNPGIVNNLSKSVCVWANELRVTDFDQEAGWAATARANIKLADFATVNVTGRHTTYGFGSVQQKISERARENTTEYNISSNVALEKLLPANFGLKIPMFVSYEKQRVSPRFNPLDPDVRLSKSLTALRPNQERSDYRKLVEEQAVRKSINFTDVRKEKTNPDAKSHIYDIENFSFTYSYSEISRSNISTEQYLQKNYRGGIGYSFTSQAKPIEPFKNIKFLQSPLLKWLQEFNFSPTPSNITIRGDLDRTYIKTQLRSADLTTVGVAPNFEKYFTFNRLYAFKWNLTKSLALDYDATANAVVDEPQGEINTEEKRDSIITNLKSLGRVKLFSQRVNATYRLPLDKFPLTDWVSADVGYTASYNWTAASLAAVDTSGVSFGNIIQNTRQRNVAGRIDLVKLYNKVKILKAINEPAPRQKQPQAPVPQVPPGQEAAKDSTAKKRPELRALKAFARAIMSARSITVNYSIEDGTTLAGFMGTPRFFGLDSSFTNPGIPFILGSQDPSILRKLEANNLLSTSTSLNTPFNQISTTDFSAQTALEPFRDFKIQLNLKQTRSTNYNEIFRVDEVDTTQFNSFSPTRSGTFTMSFIAIKTAFNSDNRGKQSSAFEQFEANRHIIRERLESKNQAEGSYNINSQDVLVPAFLAAYSGKDVREINLSPFPKIPLPNWRIDYAGLSKIESLKKIFSSVNLTHSYSSTYAVGDFMSALEYGREVINPYNRSYEYYMPTLATDSGMYMPVYVMNSVAITERFAPLVGINVRTVSKMTFRVEYNMERNLLLQMNSRQLNEMNNKDIVLGVGFTKANVRVPFRIQGKNVVLKNDLTFRCDFTLRDSKTLQRNLDENSTITAGNVGVQFKPSIDYAVSQRLNFKAYFERLMNTPWVSISYPTYNTNFGFQLRYSLSQ